jgi:hypothetical protein
MAAWVAVIALMVALGACSRDIASGESTEGLQLDSIASEARSYPASLEVAYSGIPAGDSAGYAADGRKLVVTANLRVRLTDVESGDAELNGIMDKYDAYSASITVHENRRRYSLRVPSPSYASCLADLKQMGKTLSYSEETEDVTARYYDLESRLGTQRELLKTFQSYLAKAASIDEIMTVERHIAELQSEIDRAGSQFKGLSNRIEYAAIELELLGPESAQTRDKPTVGERAAGLFRAFADYASIVMLVLLGIVIYGTSSVLIIALLYWLLLGKIGLLKKVWRLAGGKRT